MIYRELCEHVECVISNLSYNHSQIILKLLSYCKWINWYSEEYTEISKFSKKWEKQEQIPLLHERFRQNNNRNARLLLSSISNLFTASNIVLLAFTHSATQTPRLSDMSCNELPLYIHAIHNICTLSSVFFDGLLLFIALKYTPLHMKSYSICIIL